MYNVFERFTQTHAPGSVWVFELPAQLLRCAAGKNHRSFGTGHAPAFAGRGHNRTLADGLRRMAGDIICAWHTHTRGPALHVHGVRPSAVCLRKAITCRVAISAAQMYEDLCNRLEVFQELRTFDRANAKR